MGSDLIVITDSDLPGNATENVLSDAGYRVVRASCSNEQDVLDVATGARALIVQWAPITASVIDSLDTCEFISRIGIGLDMIDLDAATSKGIAVANTPDYCVEEVAAHTAALVLAGTRGLPTLDAGIRRNQWEPIEHAPLARRPSAMTAVVLGFGRIGRRVARILDSVGFRVIVSDPYVPLGDIGDLGYATAPLEQALLAADVLTLHVPLTPETRGLIGERELALIPPGSLIVNTCRGGLIDEQALARALLSGHVGGAGLDVFEHEPLSQSSPLRDAPNVILTPHAAWYSPESLADLTVCAAHQTVDFLAGRRPQAIVNPRYVDALQSGRP